MAAGSRQSNLPAEISSFVGRRREVADVRRMLGTARLLTLTGPGGVGKTRLALTVARHARRVFADGVWLVELAALQDATLLAQTIADAVGIRNSSRSSSADLLNHVETKQLLLVLDNCEHVLDACAVLTAELLAAAPRLRILATSRQALGTAGEHVLAVPPLATQNSERGSSDEPVHSEAMRLFAARATAAAPGFQINADNRVTAVQICRRLDGLPLAIELAAVRLRSLQPEQILMRLEDRFRLLVGGSRSAPPRHQTLRAVIDWSHDLCSREEQSLWARISVFAGEFDLDAAEAVCSGGVIDRARMIDLVYGLVDKSILTWVSDGAVARYRLLETLREYGRDRLRAAGEEAVLCRRHRDYYLRLAERGAAEWFGPTQLEVFTRTRREHANLRVALEFCLTTPGESQAGLRMAGSLYFYWLGCGFVGEGRRWLDRVLALDTVPTRVRATALWVNAHLAVSQGDSPSGADMAGESRDWAQRHGDERTLAYAVMMQASALLISGDPARAEPLYEEALARFEALGEVSATVGLAYAGLAMLVQTLGDPARAVTLCRRGLALCESHGEQWARSYVLYFLAMAEWAGGELEQAATHAGESLRTKHVFHDTLGLALVVELLAWIAATADDCERAAVLLGAVHGIWPLVGGQPLVGSPAWIVPHEACERQARHALGDSAFEAAFARGTKLGLDEGVAYALGEETAPSVPVPTAAGTAWSPLTRREQQVAGLLAEGLSNKEIAARLVIAQRTVDTHVARILAKLGLTSRAQVAAWMVEQREIRER